MSRIPVAILKTYSAYSDLEHDVKTMAESLTHPERILLQVSVTKQVMDDLYNKTKYVRRTEGLRVHPTFSHICGLYIEARLPSIVKQSKINEVPDTTRTEN